MTLLYSSFIGGRRSAASVTLSDATYSDTGANPEDATITMTLSSTGNLTTNTGIILPWLLSGAASDYDVRATIVSGSFSSGTSGSWLNLGTIRSWNVTRTSLGSKSCAATFEIRRASDSSVLDTASITLTATVES